MGLSDKRHCRTVVLLALVLNGLNEIHGDPVCGFPAVANHARIEGLSWESNNYRSFKAGEQLIFSCETHFHPIGESKPIKTCCGEDQWTGEDIQCYEKIAPPFHSYITNSSQIYHGNLPFIYEIEQVGEIELILPEIRSISFVEIHLPLEKFNGSLSNPSNLPEINIGKNRCILNHSPGKLHDKYQLLYNCHQSKSKGFVISSPHPIRIDRVAVYRLPGSKCSQLPAIPSNCKVFRESSLRYHYQCREGFDLRGNDTRICDPESGEWLSDLPKCELADPSQNKGSSLLPLELVSLISFSVLSQLFTINGNGRKRQ